MPKLKKLAATYEDQGLVLIGVHSKRKGENMPAFVREKGIQYPVAWDSKGAYAEAFGVDGYPDYQVIDRSGKVRVADLANAEVERVVRALLAEPAPSAVPAPLASAAATAVKKDTRILAVIGSEAQRQSALKVARSDRSLAQLLRYEYALAELDPAEHGDLLEAAGIEDGAPSLVAYAADGALLGERPLEGLDAAGLRGFLEEHQLPAKDAEALWAAALTQADREQKRILVHLGAPW